MAIRVLLTLRTSCGCVGSSFLGDTAPMQWDTDPVNETVQAIFTRFDDLSHTVLEVAEIDGDQWRDFEDGGHAQRFIANVRSGITLADALDFCV